jgi:two-component system, chemotaxis family, sensor kinase CheA
MADNDLLNIFWEEVSEYLSSLNEGLLQVEMVDGEEQHKLLTEMNRYAHSMKGAARAVGMGFIERTAHFMEELFHAALEDGFVLTPEVADSIYDGLDLIQNVVDGVDNNEEVVKEVLANLEKSANTITGDDSSDDEETISKQDKLNAMIEHKIKTATDEFPALDVEPKPAPTPPQKKSSPIEVPVIQEEQRTTGTVEVEEIMPTMAIRAIEESIRVPVSKLDNLMAQASELAVAKMQGEERARVLGEMIQKLTRWQREWRSVRAAYIRLARRMQDNDTPDAELNTVFKFLESNQRYLTESNREMAQLRQLLAQDNMQINTLSDQLQDDVSRLRMMPFETIVGGFQRMVRDIARDLGKQVRLSIIGTTVEIDKTVLDALKDPLMHLLRNSIDHGLESPEERDSFGKPPTGTIGIHVEQRGSEILMRISDDGRGLDLNRIRMKAVEKGILNSKEANALSPEETQNLIFHSGFSTNDEVNSLSGRGLGMDIVRDRIEGLRGRVTVSTTPREGTIFTLSVPVSLTRIRCILLSINDENYAIPSIMVSRMTDYSRSDVFTAEGKDMVTINNQPMPLVSMGAILDIPANYDTERDGFPIVALESGDRIVAFEVDELYSETELVLKPLGHELQNIPYVSGAALLGSGEVIIVFDANDLIRKASGVALPRRRMTMVRPATPEVRRIRVL